MTDEHSRSQAIQIDGHQHRLKFLHPRQIAMIDEALASVEEFGEIRLIVEKKRLRFIVTQRSFDALKWQPGALTTADES